MGVKGLSRMKFVMDLQAQQHWDWRVALYLYGAGTSAGLIFLEVALRHFGMIGETTALYGMWIGLGLALLSLGFLFDHLGPRARWRFLYAFRKPRTSWIARGAIIVTALVILRLLILLPTVPGFERLPLGENTPGGGILRAAVLVFAVAFMAYSGLVLSSWNSIAFWNTPMLPALYVGYSFLGGAAALPVVSVISGGASEAIATAHMLWPYLLGMLLANGFALLLYLWGMSTADVASRESVRRLIKGELRASFWAGVVAFGLIVPSIAIFWVAGNHRAVSPAALILVAACLAIQAGAYLLRENFLRVGVYGEPV